MAIQHINEKEFLSKIWDFNAFPETWKFAGSRPAIVDFFAVWCGPCRMLGPVLEDIAEEYAGKLDVYKVDTDEETDLCTKFGISSIPALLFCPVSGDPQMVVGYHDKDQIEDLMKEIFK